MQTRAPLTTLQLLTLVLSACRDAGYPQVGRHRIVEVLYGMRERKPHPLIPKLEFSVEYGQVRALEIYRTLEALPHNECYYDPIAETMQVLDRMSHIPIYRPLFEGEREDLDRYVGDFIQALTAVPRP